MTRVASEMERYNLQGRVWEDGAGWIAWPGRYSGSGKVSVERGVEGKGCLYVRYAHQRATVEAGGGRHIYSVWIIDIVASEGSSALPTSSLSATHYPKTASSQTAFSSPRTS